MFNLTFIIDEDDRYEEYAVEYGIAPYTDGEIEILSISNEEGAEVKLSDNDMSKLLKEAYTALEEEARLGRESAQVEAYLSRMESYDE